MALETARCNKNRSGVDFHDRIVSSVDVVDESSFVTE